MKKKSPLFCVILGPDGAGKTTLLERLKQVRDSWKYISANPNDLYPIRGIEYQNWTLEKHPREYMNNMRPYTRGAFYINTIAIEYEYFLQDWLNKGETILCDSYWYRFFAKEQFYNPVGNEIFGDFVKVLPAPDLIIWLNTNLKTSFYRKRVGKFEVADGNISLDNYVDFQEKIILNVKKITQNILSYEVDADLPPDKVAEEAIKLIKKHLYN